MGEPEKQNGNISHENPIEIEVIEHKYGVERDKRLRKEGLAQFRDAVGDLSKFDTDPLAKADPSRAPIDEAVDVLIIGCGFGGILAARSLREKSVTNFRMIDKAADFGGVWYWNRYPGLGCDTDAYIYLPLLEEMNYMPSKNYIPGHEIYEYALKIAKKEDLRPQALFQTEATTATWSDESARWIVETTQGDRIQARFVMSAIGILNKIHLPGIQGIDTFGGESFHSSRWDYSITGGDQFGAPLDKLRGKRVALIGTGASTVQSLPHLTASGAEVYVYQRTPSGVDEREIKPTDERWYRSQKPGWQDERIRNFDRIFFLDTSVERDIINDGWTQLPFSLIKKNSDKPDITEMKRRAKIADIQKMEEVRARVDKIVQDKLVADCLKPWYGRNCKRPCFHNDYLRCFNAPNVHLVNTDGSGLERITKTGIVANGEECQVDYIIFATGFDNAGDYSQRANMVIKGRNGRILAEKWTNGPSTLHGMHSRDFPNYLILSHLQNSISANYTSLLRDRAIHAAYIVSECLKRGIRSIEPTSKAEDSWVQELETIALQSLDYFKACTPGYLNSEGEISAKNLRSAPLGMSPPQWNALMQTWRDEGSMQGLEIDRSLLN